MRERSGYDRTFSNDPPERALAAIETMRLRLNDDRALARWVDVYRQSGWRSPPLLPMRAVAEEREPR